MSYKEALSDINRDGDVSLTQQIVDVFAAAIEAGDLGPGDRLPPTREVAEQAGVNHLTAARAYRKLSDLGLVTGRVGSGTYVRASAAATAAPTEARNGPSDPGWQHYALPEETEMHSDRVVTEMLIQADQADETDLLPFSVGYPGLLALPARAHHRDHRRRPRQRRSRGPAVHRDRGAVRAARRDRRPHGPARVGRGSRRDHQHHRRPPGAGARRPRDPAARRRRRLRVAQLLRRDRRRPHHRRPHPPGPDRRRRHRHRGARAAPAPPRDPHDRRPAAPQQPDGPRPLARAPRAPRRARPPPRLLHPRGRDLRRHPLRGGGAAAAARRRPGPRRLRGLADQDGRRRAPAGVGCGQRPRAGADRAPEAPRRHALGDAHPDDRGALPRERRPRAPPLRAGDPVLPRAPRRPAGGARRRAARPSRAGSTRSAAATSS